MKNRGFVEPKGIRLVVMTHVHLPTEGLGEGVVDASAAVVAQIRVTLPVAMQADRVGAAAAYCTEKEEQSKKKDKQR